MVGKKPIKGRPSVSIVLSLYRSEKYLAGYLDELSKQVANRNIELSLVLNDPSTYELDVLDRLANGCKVVRAIVPRENLYKSMNRAILQSSGEYLTWWNVDDIRTPDSIETMASVLDECEDVGWTYGDFKVIKDYRCFDGRLVSPLDFTGEVGTRVAQFGPFYMWRRSLIDRIGLFDEQFKSAGDFDYTVRLSLGSVGKKAAGLHGYFLNSNSGLSTRSSKTNDIERTVIQLRYRIYPTVDLRYIGGRGSYRVDTLFYPFGIEQRLENVLNWDKVRERKWERPWISIIYTIGCIVVDTIRPLKRALCRLI